MIKDPEHAINKKALVEAANWFATLRDAYADESDRAAWRRWLDTSEEHRRAWALVESIDNDFAHAASYPGKQALNGAGRSRRTLLKAILGASIALPAAWASRESAWVRQWSADFRTATGEIREVQLDDGSRLWLNTETAMEVDFTPSHRTISLLKGEIHIHTAADPRPLKVQAPGGSVHPIGTEFTVGTSGNGLLISVKSGQVDVERESQSLGRVSAGQAMTVTDASSVSGPARSHDFSWVRGTLVADNLRLEDFLERLSSHHSGIIHWTPDVADLKIVGAYPLGNTDRILAALGETLPISIRRITPWFVMVSGG